MRLLDRYLLRELLIPLAFCLCGFLIFWLVLNLRQELDDLMEIKMGGADIVRYFAIKLPGYLPAALPMALLLAMLYALSQHTRHNEITAIRAAGVSLWRLAAPYFMVGIAASVLMFILNETWIPDIADRAAQIRARYSAKQEPEKDRRLEKNFGFRNSRDGRAWQAAVYNRETSEMTNPTVNWTLSDGSHRWIVAESAVQTNGAWLFLNARLYRDDAGTAPVPILQTNTLFMAQFDETREQINSTLKVARRMGFRSLRDVDIPLLELLNYLQFNPKPSKADRNMLYTHIQGRLASPWVCLVVVFIALPFGAASGRKSIFAGVAGSVFICFAFMSLRELALALGAGGYIVPWLAAWAPNILFASAGAWLASRVR